MGPLAARSAARAEADFAEPDEAYVARARINWETYMQVCAPDGSGLPLEQHLSRAGFPNRPVNCSPCQ